MDASKTVWIHAYLDGTFLEVNANNATMISMALQLPNASATRVDALAATPLSLQTYKLHVYKMSNTKKSRLGGHHRWLRSWYLVAM